MNYIVYKTTNLRNKKFYIGIHKQPNLEFDGYLGSGVLLHSAIKKYGEASFVRETLFVFSDLEEARRKEKELVSEEFCKSRLNYNVSIGGTGGNTTAGYSEDHLRLILEKRKKTAIKNGSYNYSGEKLKKAVERMLKCRVQPDNRGRSHVGEQLERMREASKNRIGKWVWITNGDISSLHRSGEKIPEGWRLGRGSDTPRCINHSEETKQKIAEKIRGDVCYNNGIINLKLKRGQPPPDGFILGMIQKKHDMRWITNGVENMVIRSGDVPQYGWWFGRTMKPKLSRTTKNEDK